MSEVTQIGDTMLKSDYVPLVHKKLEVVSESLMMSVFADYYRYGDGDSSYPLVLYFGGAISKAEYDKRRLSKPEPIVSEFNKAWADLGNPNVDFLIIPYPPCEGRAVFHDMFSAILLGFLPQCGNRHPPLVACVGNSLGGSLATFVTFSLAPVKALALIGGYGMVEGASESPMVGSTSAKSYVAFWNFDSTGYMENLMFFNLLSRYDAAMEIITSPGGHDFEDYAKNGSVLNAFKFVLDRLLEPPRV